MGTTLDLDAFLTSCKESGNQSYSNFKDLLTKLQDPNTRADARRFLAQLEDATKTDDAEECMKFFNFRIHQLALSGISGAGPKSGGTAEADGGAERQSMTLLEMSSIFIPEEWSFTFYEGLIRHPDRGFRDRLVCELGCGNGWISIALAQRCSPAKIWGLDINPRAIKIAWINLYLNALRGDGTPVVDSEGKSLLDRVEFYESDLLGYIRDNGIVLDRVVGCIPQVLSPDPKAALKMVSEGMSEEFLYSLSNYCSLQGYVEDQFGLGLIARAVEESIEVVKPTGAVILNMGGRPGQAVCERLFLRRGFNIKKLWQTRVFQAQDTDITALVEIEKESRHRFEFFMGPVAEEPISARTAYAYAHAGGRIAHGLTVYEVRLKQPNHVKDIFRFLQRKGMEDTRSAVDLSFPTDSIADEKLAFLAHLACTLDVGRGCLAPAESSAGSHTFRSQIAAFLRLYFRIPLSSINVVVLPTRATAIENLLRLYAPPLALVDSALTRSLPRAWLSSLPVESVPSPASQPCTPVVLQAPRRTDLICKLAHSLKPQMIVASLADFEARSTTAFQQLIDVSSEVGARLFLDISEHLELSSMPSTNGVLQFLAENALPPHVGIICGLVKNQVYSDMEIAFVISESCSLLDALASAGELTFFRAPHMQQLFYGCLFHELLSFQIPHRHTVDTRPLVAKDELPGKPALIQVSPCASSAFGHPAISFCHLATADSDSGAVRMDVAPFALPSPFAVQQFTFEGFVRQHISEAEMDPRPELLQLLARRFSIKPESTSIILGEGSSALLAQLMAACAADHGTAVFPSGTFGNFVATAKFYGNPVSFVPTDAANEFKLTPEKLSSSLESVKRPWLLLSAPVVNPTGAIYSGAELSALLATCRQHGARVILDAYFAGLQFPDGRAEESLDLEAAISPSADQPRFAVAVLTELSPKLSLGGLLFAFLAVRDPWLKEQLSMATPPHGTTRYAAKKITALLNQADSALTAELQTRRTELARRAKQLSEVLARTGWTPLPPKGGIFLIAQPTAYHSKSFTYTLPASDPASAPVAKTVNLDSENIAEALYASVDVVINNSAWVGIPGYCQFVFALDQKEYEAGLLKLQQFHKLVG